MSNTSGVNDEEVAATIEALRGSLSIMSPRAALGRSIRITAESVLEAIGNNTYGGVGGGDSDEDDDYDGVYHRPMEVLEAVAETPRPMTARLRGASLGPKRIAEIDKSYVERWDVSSATAMEFLRSELKIDQLLRSKRVEDAKGTKAVTSSSSAPSSSFLGIAPAATLPAASMQEVAALEARCNALQNATGIADDAGNFDEVVVALHKRIQLLDPLYSEEMSNRCDATMSSLKRRAASKTSLFALVGETSSDHQKMHQLKELTKVVGDTYASIHAALRVVGRLQAMRGVHQEAYFRATSFAQITEELRLCDALLGSAPEELEEMKPMVADIGASVKESLAAFRERIKEIPTINK